MRIDVLILIFLIGIITLVFAWWLVKRLTGWRAPSGLKRMGWLLLGGYGMLQVFSGFEDALSENRWREQSLVPVIIGVVCLVLAAFFWRRSAASPPRGS